MQFRCTYIFQIDLINHRIYCYTNLFPQALRVSHQWQINCNFFVYRSLSSNKLVITESACQFH